MRYSLLTLMIVVLGAAAGCAVVVHASSVWGSVLFTITLASLFVAVLCAIYTRGKKRAYWVGFVIWGNAYFLLAFAPGFSQTVEPAMPTTALMEYVLPKIQQEVQTRSVTVPDDTPVSSIKEGFVHYVAIPFAPDFKRVGHSLSILVVSCIGGALAVYLHERERDHESSMSECHRRVDQVANSKPG